MANTKAKPPKQALVYSNTKLFLYDWGVLGFNMALIWECPTTSVQLPLFRDNFSKRHLDIGVATGYFPAVTLTHTPREDQHITLLDREQTSLEAAQNRILRTATVTDVVTVKADILEPLPQQLHGVKFDSISMYNLFHCVPGKEKVVALATYREVLADDGVLTGCAILGQEHASSWFTRLYLKAYGWLGWFNNWDDREEDFVSALNDNFEEVETWKHGMVLLFKVGRPRRA
jgi:ubiquinone/menaquinone biosynthesis C-methylase UbiE